MGETRYINEDYAAIANDLINEEPALSQLKDIDFTIVYLGSDATPTSNGRIIHGKCEKVPDKFKWGVPADVTITIYDGNVEDFTAEQLRILIFHELLHIGVDADGAPMNAARRAMGLPELPDKNLQIEAPKIEHELKMIRKELQKINVILKRGLKI